LSISIRPSCLIPLLQLGHALLQAVDALFKLSFVDVRPFVMTAFKIIVLWTELSILVALFIAPMFAFDDNGTVKLADAENCIML
jgi:hypothetical protein